MIASENFASPAVMAATGSVFTNKYSEGYPGRRYYGGNQIVDQVESLAIERICDSSAPTMPTSSPTPAPTPTWPSIRPCSTRATRCWPRLDHGGHLTHGSPVNASGLMYHFVGYGLTEHDERIDMDQVRALALEHRPKLIVAGATAYSCLIDPAPFRAIADEVGALLMFDAAHIAGLIVAVCTPTRCPSAMW